MTNDRKGGLKIPYLVRIVTQVPKVNMLWESQIMEDLQMEIIDNTSVFKRR